MSEAAGTRPTKVPPRASEVGCHLPSEENFEKGMRAIATLWDEMGTHR